MEPNQVHLVAAAVSCDSQQIVRALESGFTRQIVRDVGEGNRRNRIDDDVTLVHRVTTTHLDVGTRPDANAASDSPTSDSLAKAFGEHHMGTSLNGHRSSSVTMSRQPVTAARIPRHYPGRVIVQGLDWARCPSRSRVRARDARYPRTNQTVNAANAETSSGMRISSRRVPVRK